MTKFLVESEEYNLSWREIFNKPGVYHIKGAPTNAYLIIFPQKDNEQEIYRANIIINLDTETVTSGLKNPINFTHSTIQINEKAYKKIEKNVKISLV